MTFPVCVAQVGHTSCDSRGEPSAAHLAPQKLRIESQQWRQLLFLTAQAETRQPTRVGDDPFNNGVDRHCPLGDYLGLGLLTELTIASSSYGADDVTTTRQFVGVRRGVLRPRRLIVISSRVGAMLRGHKLTGFDLEVAHLV